MKKNTPKRVPSRVAKQSSKVQAPVRKINFQRIEADPEIGLTDKQVYLRKQAGYDNKPVESPSKSVKEIIQSNTFTYFNGVFATIALILILVGSFRDLVFLPVIIANTLIGIIQEVRSKRTLDRLSMLNASRAVVVRNSQKYAMKAADLVLDDIVIFTAGRQICADAVVVDGEVQVNEALLTGEADEITKGPGDSLMSGSYVVSGQCSARLTRVGEDSYISKLTLEAKAAKQGEQSEMIKALNRIVLFAGILVIPIGFLLFYQQFFIVGADVRSSVTSSVAAIIGMIPEGLYLLTSVALAVSAIRLAGQKVLLHDMKCIETLARVDTLCVDKTGTITKPQMEVTEYLAMDGYEPGAMPPLEELIGQFAAGQSNDNETMIALQAFFKVDRPKKPQAVFPFTSKVKYSATVIDDVCYVAGAPEFILRHDFEAYKDAVDSYSSQGFRVLVFGSCSVIPEQGQPITGTVTPLGLLLLTNPIRENAHSTFEYFRKQGVNIKVISGDNPVTVANIAAQAGIEDADRYVDASTLDSPEALARAATKYTVFGRVTPEQKRALVIALKRSGRTVAMTGDGVNDILALKEADCSVAMASGSDAAAQASQLVLLNSDFGRMPFVVAEGRRVINNIQRTASLFLVKNIFSLLMAVFSAIFVLSYPLEPAQISLISAFTIGVPAFFLSLEPNKERISGRFLSNVLLKALPAGLTDFLVISALVIFCNTFAVDSTDISTAATLILAIVGFMILHRISCPMTKFHWVLLFGNIIALILCIIFLPQIFAIKSISVRCLMLLVVFSIVTEPCLRYLSIPIEWFRNKLVSLWYRSKH